MAAHFSTGDSSDDNCTQTVNEVCHHCIGAHEVERAARQTEGAIITAMAGTDKLVIFENVWKRYGSVTALSVLNFEVQAGDLFGWKMSFWPVPFRRRIHKIGIRHRQSIKTKEFLVPLPIPTEKDPPSG